MKIKMDKQGMKKLEKTTGEKLSDGLPTGENPKETAAAREKHLKANGVAKVNRRALRKQTEEAHKSK
ncbi:hypothetical protein [Corynebacterium sp. AOP40-4SA-5]|uniref:hypothetical protein n=1 Tax=Corynebacterium sp. AOP40-4SA-5 TaxID=3457678 RepID=UPI004033DA4D